MAAILRKDLLYLFVKSRVSISASLFQFYSSSAYEKTLKNPTVYDFLLHKHHLSPEVASKAASVLPPLKNPERADSILSFFKENGFSSTHLEKIVNYKPAFIAANLEKSIKPKIKIFQEMGFSNDDIADMISSNASILFRSADKQVIPSLSVLRDLLGSDAEVVKLLMKSGWFIVKDLSKSMIPIVEFLKARFIHMEQIIRCMHSYPRLFLQNPEKIRRFAEKAEEMGVGSSSKMYIHAIRVVGSMSDESWERKLEAFRSLGFSENDILIAFRKCPPAFAVSVKKMKKVKEVLVSSGKYDISCIVAHPTSLMASVEMRYKPRLQVLAALESKKLIAKWPPVSSLITITDEAFFRRFVSSYVDEIGSLFEAKSGKRKLESLPSK